MHDYLLIKATSLAAEAALIRNRENKRLQWAREARDRHVKLIKSPVVEKHEKVYKGLNDHRRTVVRNEARWTNLARGFLRGHEYIAIERISYQQPNWDRVEKLVMDYGEGDKAELATRFAAWKQRALAGHNANYEPNVYPGSTRKHLSSWVLRNHNNSYTAWAKWRREQFPLRPKKEYVAA